MKMLLSQFIPSSPYPTMSKNPFLLGSSIPFFLVLDGTSLKGAGDKERRHDHLSVGQTFGLTNLKVEEPLIEMRETEGGAGFEVKDLKFSLRHVKIEMGVDHAGVNALSQLEV